MFNSMSTLNKKLAVIYVRGSSANANSQEGAAGQEEACRAAAAKDGYQEIIVIKDVLRSPSLNNPGIQQVLKHAKEEGTGAVYTTSCDRITRSVVEYIQFKKLLDKHGVVLNFARSYGDVTARV